MPLRGSESRGTGIRHTAAPTGIRGGEGRREWVLPRPDRRSWRSRPFPFPFSLFPPLLLPLGSPALFPPHAAPFPRLRLQLPGGPTFTATGATGFTAAGLPPHSLISPFGCLKGPEGPGGAQRSWLRGMLAPPERTGAPDGLDGGLARGSRRGKSPSPSPCFPAESPGPRTSSDPFTPPGEESDAPPPPPPRITDDPASFPTLLGLNPPRISPSPSPHLLPLRPIFYPPRIRFSTPNYFPAPSLPYHPSGT